VADYWDKEFEVPIPLASGRSLVTLRDARVYIDKLSKTKQASRAWQLAAKELLMAATDELAWRLIARIAIINALYGNSPPSKSSRFKKQDQARERRRARK